MFRGTRRQKTKGESCYRCHSVANELGGSIQGHRMEKSPRKPSPRLNLEVWPNDWQTSPRDVPLRLTSLTYLIYGVSTYVLL